MAKRKRYTDKFRSTAVIMLEAQGYPDKKGALTKVANHLKVPARTLSRWFNREQADPPDILVNEKRGDLAALIEGELNKAIHAMDDARPDASYRDLATATGILVDKLQLLTGQATSREEVTSRVKVIDYGFDTNDDESTE